MKVKSTVVMIMVILSTIPLISANSPVLIISRQWDVHRDIYGWNPVTSGIVAADVISNGEGVLEIFSAGQYYAACYNGATGALIWRRNFTNADAHVMQSIDDIDNDGGKELIITYFQDATCLNAEDGTLVWNYRLPYPVENPNRLDKHSVIIDADETGYKYVYLAAEAYGYPQPSIVKLNWLGVPVAMAYFDAYTCWGGLAAADLDGDGQIEIIQSHRRVGTTAYGGIVCYNEDLSIKWNYPYVACSSHPPSIADVNGDGILDVIAGYQGVANHRGLWVMSGDDGHIINGANDCGINVWFDMAVYDIDSDGHLEVISASSVSEQNPTPLPSTVFDLVTWTKEATLAHPIGVSPSIGNVDSDPEMEIISLSSAYAGSQGMTIYEYSEGTYNAIFQQLNEYYCGQGDTQILDVDGDGFNEMITQNTGYYNIVCWQTEGVASYPQSRASSSLSNERRTKVSEYVPPPGGEPEIPKTITIISPNGGENWTRGSTQTIFWSYTGEIGNVTIELYKNESYDSTISTSTVNNGSFSWTITQNTGTTYKIKVSDTSNTTVRDESNDYFSIAEKPNPPSSPTIDGLVNGKINVQYHYAVNAVDPDGDDVYYYVNWGDMTNTGWVGSFVSGVDVIVNHTWTKKGIYTIKAKAKDIYGAESDWGTLAITMPASFNIPIQLFWEKIFERFPNVFPILRYLSGYY
jgi:hypothetical protein